MKGSVPAQEVDDIFESTTPGAFKFYKQSDDQIAGMNTVCPCGCGAIRTIPFSPPCDNGWQWDGNREAPTVSPSLKDVHHCKWHGWLRAGQWVSC